ncbi:flagellar hook-associated protein FlgK [Anaerocolumna sp. MB42-C2]|uniref:flagellar hook-associated protein FlgK n=1 Tax=Anaerocolumna sp. MB42-C2 TaxID=3070997 RepID=UPI0027E0B732|nr:flagellar hook-associated protein FlgK [Anaerocolumna sp. MB42-C2]WMJ90236.1 flagellar hook-associated protein FlgK [Anaerocolumna sp. MB42-C2]
MPSTFFGLNIGTSGLYAYQAALNTTAHNVANTKTEGYTRQVVNQKAGVAIRVNSSYGMAGTGVDVTGITQTRNSYYDVKYRENNTIYGSYSAKEYSMTEIENYFNEVTLEGFTTTFNNFFNSMQGLSTSSADLTKRTEVTNFAKSLTEYFNNLSANLSSTQEECNFEVKNQVERINSLGAQIAQVTKQINVLESSGGTANDLRDQRQLLLDDLSGIVNISYSENVVGNDVGVTSFTVKINGQTLVNTDSSNTLKLIPRKEKADQNDIDGLYDIEWDNGNTFNTKSPTLGGYLKSLIEVRDGNNNEGFRGQISEIHATTLDGKNTNEVVVPSSNINAIEKLNIPSNGVITIGTKEYKYDSFKVEYDPATNTSKYHFFVSDDDVLAEAVPSNVSIGENINYKGIPYYQSQLNELVRTFSKKFNDLHKSGQDLKGDKGLDFFNGKDPVTEDNYQFDHYEDYYKMTAANFTITDEILNNPSKFVTTSNGQIVNGVENNDVLTSLLALKKDVSMFKQGTPASFFQTLVGEVGIDTKKAKNFAESQKNILDMISNQRLSVAGVDEDEEAMNLVKFQNAYNLSAKVIQTMNEIYDKLINGTGV